MPIPTIFPNDRFACLHGGTVRVILLLLFSQCGDDDDSYLLAGSRKEIMYHIDTETAYG